MVYVPSSTVLCFIESYVLWETQIYLLSQGRSNPKPRLYALARKKYTASGKEGKHCFNLF